MTVREALRHGAAVLAAVDDPAREARLLLAHVTGLSLVAQIADPDRMIDAAAYQALLDRRAAHEPVALIVGHAEFWSLPFAVSRDTLLPRPDSETVVQAALDACPAPGRVLDLGTGTGCLLLSVLHERPGAWGVGVELSPAAAALARRNAAALGLAGRSAFVCGSWADAVRWPFDLVVSNPPYIRQGDLAGLAPEIRLYEPARALDGGPDGLDAYRAIMAVLPGLLAPGGVAVLEVGYDQADAVAALASGTAVFVTDLASVRRAIVLRYDPPVCMEDKRRGATLSAAQEP